MAHGHDEPPEKGTVHSDGHGHSPSAELKFDVIAEGSPQDKLLVILAALALCLLIFFGYNMAVAQLPG